ncbi:tryptophan synthase subunit alpha [Cytobacillus spongiae]|jgi:tryptophan synthase alpha chain|uniref:tryptophan synthase subunit alpha n=1 Tax=Cytobacillus spongiae TaxID=2901381 RepID=UPI001F373D9F|nr:tryptophan synthase subunit alpha [Cytobacillus spongiae]UII54373.1 tryptophan synthase subunit alpha [Cytobacillus spongiae]
MNRIAKALAVTLEKGEKAFVPYIMGGDGGLSELKKRVLFLAEAGATAIEIGIPFSDPVADGPVIQQAGIRALTNGVTLKNILDTIADVRPVVPIPIIIMTYVNPIYSFGIPAFIEAARKAGVDGCIIPDLPIEEEEIIAPLVEHAGIEFIRLVTLTSTTERIEQITHKGNGFVYAVTVNGITGTRKDVTENLAEHLQKIKEISPIPVLAGFGISTPNQVQDISMYCDGVIVGSKMVELFEQKDFGQIQELIQAAKGVIVT